MYFHFPFLVSAVQVNTTYFNNKMKQVLEQINCGETDFHCAETVNHIDDIKLLCVYEYKNAFPAEQSLLIKLYLVSEIKTFYSENHVKLFIVKPVNENVKKNLDATEKAQSTKYGTFQALKNSDL